MTEREMCNGTHVYDPQKINDAEDYLYCQCGNMRIMMTTAKDVIREQEEKK